MVQKPVQKSFSKALIILFFEDMLIILSDLYDKEFGCEENIFHEWNIARI